MTQYRIRPGRPGLARETAAKYGAPVAQPTPASSVYHVTVTDRGRLVLPAEIRQRLRIRDGDQVALSVQADGTIEIETRDVAIRKMRGMFKHLNRPGEPVEVL